MTEPETMTPTAFRAAHDGHGSKLYLPPEHVAGIALFRSVGTPPAVLWCRRHAVYLRGTPAELEGDAALVVHRVGVLRSDEPEPTAQ